MTNHRRSTGHAMTSMSSMVGRRPNVTSLRKSVVWKITETCRVEHVGEAGCAVLDIWLQRFMDQHQNLMNGLHGATVPFLKIKTKPIETRLAAITLWTFVSALLLKS